LELPSARWLVSTEPPEAAIQAMMDDIVYETEKKGKQVDRATLREKSIAYLKTNNLFVFNPQTAAYLMVSLSEAKTPPSPDAVKASAEWALEAIIEHAEVMGGHGFVSSLKEVALPGATLAYRIDTDYPLRKAPHNFIGIIGYADPSWVFIYYNDKAEDPADLQEMRQIFSSLRLK